MIEGNAAEKSTQTLRKEIGLAGVVSLGVGTAIGVSIFSVLGPAAAVAGPALLVAIVIAAAPMFVVAMTYAFMGSAAPASGRLLRVGACLPESVLSPFLFSAAHGEQRRRNDGPCVDSGRVSRNARSCADATCHGGCFCGGSGASTCSVRASRPQLKQY